jgi:replicative superfamily II helicase
MNFVSVRIKALATEISNKFSKRLNPLGFAVRDWTGDTQLSAMEIEHTQLFVTTPEKWDVITRKQSAIDTTIVRLLLLDEVHLLHDERGAVIETLVARTMRQAERTQSLIRIVGLSATLPNYRDVAEFLGVNLQRGLFVFDDSFRPVPLGQSLIGVKGKHGQARERMNTVMYEKVVDVIRQDRQAMVFVHSRKDTVKTGLTLLGKAKEHGELDTLFGPVETELKQFHSFEIEVSKSRNKELKTLFKHRVGIQCSDQIGC